MAKGTPLSVRIRCGSPYSLKSRVNTGFASTTQVCQQAVAAEQIPAVVVGDGERDSSSGRRRF